MKRLFLVLCCLFILSLFLYSSAIAQERQLLTGQSKQISDLQAQNKALEQRVNQLQQQMAVLLQIIKISGTDVEISAGRNLTIKAGAAVQVNPSISLNVRTPTFNVHSDSSTIESTGSSSIKAGATMSLQSSVLFLNGSKPVATVGSTVAVGGNTGQIISGSARVFAE